MLSVIFGNGTTRTAIGSGLTNTNIVQVKAFIFRDEDLLRTLSKRYVLEEGQSASEKASNQPVVHINRSN